jgi:ABC-type transport system substrate-binding protein
MEGNNDGESRRGFLKASAVGAVLGTTGCLRFAGGNETDTAATETREPTPGEPASAQFQFAYDADAQAVTITVVGDVGVPAGDLQIRGGGRAVAWSALGSTGVAAGDTLGDGATVTVGPDVDNWETPIDPDDTVRVVYLGGDSPTTVAQYTPPESATVTTTIPPTEAATPTETETETEPEPDTPTETETVTEPPEQTPPGTLRLTSEPTATLDPVEAVNSPGQKVIQQLFDALLGYQNATTIVENRLAVDFTVSDDFTTYTFTLADATFHDGRPVTAADVVYSFERVVQSDSSARAFIVLDSLGITHDTDDSGNYEPGSLGVTAVDDRTVRIELEDPFHPTLEGLASTWFSVVPEGLVGDVEGYSGELSQSAFARRPVGAGPFELETYDEGDEIAVVANPDYHGDGPAVGELRWVISPNAAETYQAALNEELDVFTVPDSAYERGKVTVDRTDDAGREIGTYGELENGKTANYAAVPRLDVFYVGFNMAAVPKPIRQAVAHVTNQTQLNADVFADRNEPATHVTPPTIYPGGPSQYTSHAGSYPYDEDASNLDTARQLVEDAGYGPDNTYTLTWTQYNSDTWRTIAERLKGALSDVHVELRIEVVGFGELLSRGRNGDLEAYTLGWAADLPYPRNFLQLLYPPNTKTGEGGTVNPLNWNSDTGDAASTATAAYERILSNQEPTDDDASARGDAVATMEEANWEDVGLIPIYHQVSEHFWYDTLEGFTPPGTMDLAYRKLDDVGVDR